MAGKQQSKKRRQFLGKAIAEFQSRPQRRKEARIKRQAKSAAKTFRPRKADRGKIIFVGINGKRSGDRKGRKGYPVYVTKTGKKWLLKQHGEEGYKARTAQRLKLPGKRLQKAVKQFQHARLVKVGLTRRAVLRQTGKVKGGGANDFSAMVKPIAASIRKTLEAQKSHRIFLIRFIALVKIPGGGTQSISGEVPIERADHIYIRLAGIQNFVRAKFYAFMARELAFAGYVSNGSANHIRRLADNRGQPRDKWVDKRGELWAGRFKQQVEILSIEWTIEQAR